MKNNTQNVKILYILFIYLIISFIIYRIPLFNFEPFYTIISGDLVVPQSIVTYLKQFYPMWNDHLSTSNWVAVSRFFLYVPF